ncbi:MAG TPA: transglycosylase domain-containing protein [Gaiellales bacterium]|jgi:penicillin-binding protein 1A|nr:transglycosylase domain-containing protein [Gaiellales bacterium]
MPDGRRRSRIDSSGALPGDARKRRRERQRRDARRTRLGIAAFVVVGILVFGLLIGLASTAAFIDHLPKLSRLGPIELGENSSVFVRNCTTKPCADVPLGVIARAENRVSVRWKDIAPTMRSATVAIEDRRYWEHGALDWHGIARAALNNVRAGGITQGGSTLTQQLAKNLYLQREASSRSISRKIDEAWIAVQLQDKYTKAEILTAYLNTVFYGQNAYGVEAAAHTFFDRPAKRLTLPQSALLAGLPQAPTDYNPFLHPAAAKQRRNEVLQAMRSLRWISAPAYAIARIAPLDLKRGSYGTAVSSPFVFEQIRQELDARLPRKLAARGGYRVFSTVDQRLQFAARRAIKDVLKSPGDPQAALVAINVHNGNVLALGTSDYFSATNQFNLATVGHRSPGSTFKLFALVTALKRGADPSRVYYPSGYVSFPENDPICPQAGGWSPHNAESGGGGYISLETATIHSVNVVYAQLMHDLTPRAVAATAHQLGVRSSLPLHCAMVLGADDVTPLELTSAYATIAAGGVYHPPRVIRRVENAQGHIVADNAFKVHSKRVVSQGIAYETTQILKQVITQGTGTGARLDDGRPEAGKTGTAENYGNAWFCGYTPDIASCVWVGYRGSNKPLEGIEGVGAVYGGTLPADIWKDFMTTATRRLAPHDWKEPKHPMVFLPFTPTTSFGYNPRPASPPAPPSPPKKTAKPKSTAPPPPATKVVIAPQNGN